MLKSPHKVLTLYYISMTNILKNRHKTDISKFLKVVKFGGLKKHPKMYQNTILCIKHTLDVYTMSYIPLKYINITDIRNTLNSGRNSLIIALFKNN